MNQFARSRYKPGATNSDVEEQQKVKRELLEKLKRYRLRRATEKRRIALQNKINKHKREVAATYYSANRTLPSRRQGDGKRLMKRRRGRFVRRRRSERRRRSKRRRRSERRRRSKHLYS